MKKLNDMVIYQNYFSPYRHKLFEEISKKVKLTVIYMQKPQEEGRQWQEEVFAKNKSYLSIQLENSRPLPIGPLKHIVWVKGLNQLKKQVTATTKVVFLDNLPTNFTMLRIINAIKNIVPRKNRLLWEEHIITNDSDGKIKNLYKKTLTLLLALNVDTVISFSAMTTDYLKTLGIPLSGQKIVRTIQATYTREEVATYQTASSVPKILTFGFLGYMSKRKGILELLSAIRYYKNPHARFLFVGMGPLRDQIEKAAETDSRIKLKPYAITEEEKTKYFTEMSVNVVPSEKDPWCVVVTEAACRGTISLVSPNVGAKEMITLIDKSFILKNNQGITLAKAFAEIETRFANKKEWKILQEKVLLVSKNWDIEQAAESFLKG